MEKDFSVSGREKFLCETFRNRLEDGPANWISFARWTLLERIIWAFKPENTYCHLDGFDLDSYSEFENGFFSIGRVWHLPELGSPGEIPTAMAVEFDEAQNKIIRAAIWVGRLAAEHIGEPDTACLSFSDLFLPGQEIGAEWQPAFWRDAKGWSLDTKFHLPIFLMPLK